jgi:hypothetical protein
MYNGLSSTEKMGFDLVTTSDVQDGQLSMDKLQDRIKSKYEQAFSGMIKTA